MPHGLPLRVGILVVGVVLNGVATGLYIVAGLGPGPSDGPRTGMASRGHSIRVVRTAIELIVLTVGWVLGGTLGAGTVVYAVAIGPLVHVFIPLVRGQNARSVGAPVKFEHALCDRERTRTPDMGDDDKGA